MKVYEYKGCVTCKKALKWLDGKGIEYKKIPIRETPPTKTEIKKMVKHLGGDLKRLFNTSGTDYRSLKIKEKLPTMSEKEAIELLSQNGNLIKRPFIITTDWGTTGFKEDVWEEHL